MYEDAAHNVYKFDLNPLRGQQDYIAKDNGGQALRFNLCGEYSTFKCHDETSMGYANKKPFKGVAMVVWGSPQPQHCTDKKCYDEDFNKICCTQPCNPLSLEWEPSFQVIDKSDPGIGGLVVTLPGVPNVDPATQCAWDPIHGGERLRTVSFVFECYPAISAPEMYVRQNQSGDCSYQVYIKSKFGCGSKLPIH